MFNTSKKILIPIILIVVSALVLFAIFYKEEDVPFDKVEFSSDNIIFNRDLPTYMDTIVLAGLDALQFKNKRVMIRPLGIKNSGDLDYEAYIVENYGNYFIFIKDLSRSKAIRVISHELIHLKQYEINQLEIKNGLVIWNDSEIYNSKDLPEYSKRPWEKEAFDKSPKLETKIEEILYSK